MRHTLALLLLSLVFANCHAQPYLFVLAPQEEEPVDPDAPALPEVEPTDTPPTGWDGTADVVLTDSDNLQTAINNADTSSGIYIIELTAGDTWTSEPYTIDPTDATGGGWLVIRSSNYASLPAIGTCLPESPTNDSDLANIEGANQTLIIQSSSDGSGGAKKVCFIGVNFRVASGSTPAEFLSIGRNAGGDFVDDTDDLPEDMFFWHCRVYVADGRSCYVGFSPNCKNFSCIDCDFRVRGTNPGADGATGLRWYNGIGALVQNCRFTTASFGIFLGDSSQLGPIPATDVTVRGCTLTTDPSWIGVDKCKGKFECKAANRLLIEDCELAYAWIGAQTGTAMSLKNVCETMNDVTVRNTIIRDCCYPIYIEENTDECERILFENVLCYNIDAGDYSGGAGSSYANLFAITGAADYVTLDHVTIVQEDGAGEFDLNSSSSPLPHLRIVDSILAASGGTTTGFKTTTAAVYHTAALNANTDEFDIQYTLMQGHDIANYDNNGSIQGGSTLDNNFFPSLFSSIGFNNAAADDYSIPSGTYSTASSTGGPLGFIAGETIGVNE